MFKRAVLLGSAKKPLDLMTRARTPIPNEIIPEPDAGEQMLAQRLVTLHGGKWEMRKPCCGGYNCAGHVWASRRTAILEGSAVQLSLDEDGYRELPPGQNPVSGDLVLYWDSARPGAEGWLHVGMVFELRPDLEKGRHVAWVLSKFGSTTGEFLHAYYDVPYSKQGFDLKIAFYTDRP